MAIICVLCSGAIGYSRFQEHNHVPKGGYVPDADTAAAIALAVLSPVYGKENVGRQRPFKVTLVKDTWVVEGVVQETPGQVYLGGTALVKISKRTGAILRMTHGM